VTLRDELRGDRPKPSTPQNLAHGREIRNTLRHRSIGVSSCVAGL